MSFVATARAARMRPIATADDSFAAASLFAEAASVDEDLADLAAGRTVDPFEIAEDGSAASYKLYEGTELGAQRPAEPIRTLFVSRSPHFADPDGLIYPVKGTSTVTPTVLIPDTAPAQPLTSSVTLIVPQTSVPSGEVSPTSNAIVMTTTVLV